MDKKAEVLENKLAGLSFDEVKKIDNIVLDTIKYCNFTNNVFVSALSSNEPALGPSVAKLEQGELSAPIKGDNCVFVAEKISADEETGSGFNEDLEKSRLQTIAVSNIPSSIFEALYYNAKVVDNRYKIF